MSTFGLLLLLGAIDNGFTAMAIVSSILALIGCLRLIDAYGEEEVERVWSAIRMSLWFAVPAIAIAAGIPSRRDVVESYALAEASQLATANNVKDVASEVLKRVDAFLEKPSK